MSAADLGPSLVRTLVPLIFGPVVTLFGFDINDPQTNLIVSAVVSYVFYVIVRLLELKAPVLGYLLGVAKAPVYLSPPAIVTDEDGTRVVGDDLNLTEEPDVAYSEEPDPTAESVDDTAPAGEAVAGAVDNEVPFVEHPVRTPRKNPRKPRSTPRSPGGHAK